MVWKTSEFWLARSRPRTPWRCSGALFVVVDRGKARELDRGWRIDYLLCNKAARPLFEAASIHREGGLEVSDHAPVSIDIRTP